MRRPETDSTPTLALVFILALAACETVTVTVVAVENVMVQPASTSVVAGQTIGLEAVLEGPKGSRIRDRAVTWSSSDETVASVGPDGVVAGHGEGSAMITAHSEGVTGTSSVEVLPEPSIRLDQPAITFAAPQGGDDPPVQTVQIENGGSGELAGLTVEVEHPDEQPTGWVVASLADSRAPTTLTVEAITGSLEAGSYSATVMLRSDGGGEFGLPVGFAVSDPEPGIGLDREEVEFEATLGGAAPAPREVSVTNTGGYSLTGLGASIDYRSGGSGWLTTSLSPSSAPATLRLVPNPEGIEVGTHVAVVSVFSAVAVNSPREITVRLVVSEPPPAIELDRSEVSFIGTAGGPAPEPAEVEIVNGGGGSLDGLATSIDWEGDTTGWIVAFLSDTQAPATLEITPSIAGLAPGVYGARVEVSALAAIETVFLDVTLTVLEPANQPPNADFEVECAGLACTFEERSTDPDGTVESWQWDFGDDALSSEPNPEHVYATPGTYTVVLEISDDDGATDTATRQVTVTGSENEPPEAAFTFTCGVLDCAFADESTDVDGTIVAWRWDFGDDALSSEPNPEHVYGTPGTYTVVLEISDDDGGTDTASREVTVTGSENEPPEAAFTFTCGFFNCAFTDESTDVDGTIVAWHWDFGDGGESTQQNPGHFYFPPGTYTVTLQVEDDDGATAEVSQDVSPGGVVAFASTRPGH